MATPLYGSLTSGSVDANLNLLFNFTAHPLTAPLKVALLTVLGDEVVPGTEVTNSGGSSYARQTITFTTAGTLGSENRIYNDTPITFANMPYANVYGLEIWDSSGTPQRVYWMPLVQGRAAILGETLVFPIDAISISMA